VCGGGEERGRERDDDEPTAGGLRAKTLVFLPGGSPRAAEGRGVDPESRRRLRDGGGAADGRPSGEDIGLSPRWIPESR